MNENEKDLEIETPEADAPKEAAEEVTAEEPTEAGNWWYYDQNGKPAVWGK